MAVWVYLLFPNCVGFGSLQAGQTTSVYYRGLNVTCRKNVREKFANIFANYYALGLECYAVMQHCAMQ